MRALEVTAAAMAIISLMGCDEMQETTGQANDATARSIAQYVSQSGSRAIQYFSGACGALTVRYYTAPQMSLSAADPLSDDFYSDIWYGAVHVSAAGPEPVHKVEFLYYDGTTEPDFTGRQVNAHGQLVTLQSPIVTETANTDRQMHWINLDLSRNHDGVPFTFSPLGAIVSRDARPGSYQFRPAKPHVFRVNGTRTCDITPDYARITITN